MTNPQYVYIICWDPVADKGDCGMNELVRSAATDVDSALIIAQRLAEQKSEDGVDWQADGPLKITGVRAARRDLHEHPAESVVIKIGDGAYDAYGCGEVSILPLRLETHELRVIPVDDNSPLQTMYFIYQCPGAHPQEPSVGWAAVAQPALLLGNANESLVGNVVNDVDVAIGVIESLLGRAWEGNVYAVDDLDESVLIRTSRSWLATDDSDHFAQRALQAFHQRPGYASTISVARVAIADEHAAAPMELDIAYTQQCMLIQDALDNLGRSVAVATSQAAVNAMQQLQITPQHIFVATRMSVHAYDLAADSFTTADPRLHPFIKTASSLVEHESREQQE